MLVLFESWHCFRRTFSTMLRVSLPFLPPPSMTMPMQPSDLVHLPLPCWSLALEGPFAFVIVVRSQSPRCLWPLLSSFPELYAYPRQSYYLLFVHFEAACCLAWGQKKLSFQDDLQRLSLPASRHTNHRPLLFPVSQGEVRSRFCSSTADQRRFHNFDNDVCGL